ncbi:MAG: hypothetical protein Q9201_007734, partial [Fulgogasparrea decipioides]
GIVQLLQATITANGHFDGSAKSKDLKQAREAANTSQRLFKAIYDNLGAYYQDVEPKLDAEVRRGVAEIIKPIEDIIKGSEQTVKQLQRAISDRSISRKNLQVYQDELRTNDKRLNDWQMTFSMRLQLYSFRWQSPVGLDSELQRPRPPSEASTLEPSRSTTSSDRPRLESRVSSPSLFQSSSITVESVHSREESDGYIDISKERLRRAVEKGDAEQVEALITSTWDEHGSATRASLALILACRYRKEKIVKLCLAHDPDTTLTDEQGLPCIHAVIGTADVDTEPSSISSILTLLLDHGVHVCCPDSTPEKLLPLHRCAMTKNISAAQLLLKQDQKIINIVDGIGKTALWHAVSQPSQKPKLVKLLVKKGGHFGSGKRPSLSGSKKEVISGILGKNNL